MEEKLEKVKAFYSDQKPYRPPKQVNADDPADIQDLDEIKLHELKEVSVGCEIHLPLWIFEIPVVKLSVLYYENAQFNWFYCHPTHTSKNINFINYFQI